MAHAINHHYYIVTATLLSDCLVYDITGRLLRDERSKGVNVSRITLDLDRGIYHQNFNIDKRDRLLRIMPPRSSRNSGSTVSSGSFSEPDSPASVRRRGPAVWDGRTA